MWETDSINALTRSRIRTVIGLAMMEPRYLLMAPTLGAIDMPLSFSTMMMSRPECPALFMASYGSPQVRAPSPTTATTLNCSPAGRAPRPSRTPPRARCPHGRRRTDRADSRRSEEHTSELQSLAYLVCRLLLEKKKKRTHRFLTTNTKKQS